MVVGDGVAAGSGTDVAVGSASEPKAAPAANVATDETATARTGPLGWIGGGIAGLAIGAALGSLGRWKVNPGR